MADVKVAIFNAGFEPLGQVSDYETCEVDWVNLDAGSGQIVVPETSRFAPLLMSVNTAPVMVIVTVNGIDWPGRVVLVEFDRPTGKPGSGTITATLMSEWIWLKYMMASQNGANPSLTGMPVYDQQTGPVCTVAAYYINAAAARLGAPVTAIAPSGDDSATVTLRARFPVTLSDLLTPVLAAEGVAMDVDIWTTRAKVPVGQTPPGRFPQIVFSPRQVTSTPSLRWSDGAAQVSGLHLELTAATGYEAIVGLGGDLGARVFDRVIDDPDEGTGGPYALPEVFLDSSNTALGPDSQARGHEELINHRGRLSATFTVQDGQPWTFGEHYLAGDPARIIVAGIPFLDQVTKVTATHSASNGLVITPTLGDLTIGEDMAQLTVRAIASIQSQLRLIQSGV